ncbi:asparaginase [Maribrevibacterium harenarium]|uniref:Asparaginase n=1 Tax=Maribrevibacterium harenarium TaxID=2589817 RepID=A0A501WKG4_9GAMM|nr:asparaginase [Maribrevibacterium harenarium]TPE48880.1 asparaginase [Maribrevibacterium harenarium]
MSILILYTGGTIGMTVSESGLAPSSSLVEKLHTIFPSGIANTPEYSVQTLDPLIDSANLDTTHWQRIVAAIQQHWDAYNSFIILHGTDTMAYTASLLSYVFANSCKNIILTGSQLPLGAERSDAPCNLALALSLANGIPLGQVAIAFGNQVLQGNRATKISSQAFAGFDSPNTPPLVTNQITPHYRVNGLTGCQPCKEPAELHFQPEAVALLWLTPSLSQASYGGFLHDSKCKALVLVSFGAGNIASENQSFCQFLADAKDKGLVVVNVSQCQHGGTSTGAYAAGSVLTQLGVLDGKDMTVEAAFTKLHYLLALDHSPKEIRTHWQTCRAEEWSE